MNTAVALFIFRRPEPTQRVFEAIAAARPRQLFIIGDGPRTPDEAIAVNATRAIVSRVDWPCAVRTNYADANMGLRARISSGLDWVFDQVEEAIILEDDCLPHPTFFAFCETMLARYRDEPRIMNISGNYFHAPITLTTDGYFSRYAHIWGWATWRRAWRLYATLNPMPEHDALARQGIAALPRASTRRFWQLIWDRLRTGQVNSWAYQWTLTCIVHNGLCINPAVNLVSNIGYGVDATHTTVDSPLANIPTAAAAPDPRLPDRLVPDERLDRRAERLFFDSPSLLTRAVRKARRLLVNPAIQIKREKI